VLVPYLRGHGPTRFLDPSTPRSGQQAAIGTDVIDLMDALKASLEKGRKTPAKAGARRARRRGQRRAA